MLAKPFFLSAVLLAVVATSALAEPPKKTGEVYRFALSRAVFPHKY